MGDVMEAADPADVSNAVEATEAADAVDGGAMKGMPAAMSSAVAPAMASAACDRNVWRESRGNDLFLPKPSIPPAMLIPAAEPKLSAGSG